MASPRFETIPASSTELFLNFFSATVESSSASRAVCDKAARGKHSSTSKNRGKNKLERFMAAAVGSMSNL